MMLNRMLPLPLYQRALPPLHAAVLRLTIRCPPLALSSHAREIKLTTHKHKHKLKLSTKHKTQNTKYKNKNRYEVVEFPGADAITITFDARCATESGADYLRVYKDDAHTAVWGRAQYTGPSIAAMAESATAACCWNDTVLAAACCLA